MEPAPLRHLCCLELKGTELLFRGVAFMSYFTEEWRNGKRRGSLGVSRAMGMQSDAVSC